MIQKMKKLTFLVYHKEYDGFLQSLQRLGVVHIQESEDKTVAERYSDSLTEKKEELVHVNQVVQHLQSFSNGVTVQGNGNAGVAMQYIIQADGLIDSLKGNEQEKATYQSAYEILKPWGSFKRSDLSKLKSVGVNTAFYKADSSFIKEHPEYEECVVSRDKDGVYFVVFSRVGETQDVKATPVELPGFSLEQCSENLSKIEKQTASLLCQQKDLAESHLADIIAYRTSLINDISTLEARVNTTLVADCKVMVLEGWYPVSREKEIESYLSSIKTYYEVREPLPTDNVPTLLKNGPVSRLFERLTVMYGFPDYNEWDPTPIVAPFFTLFFAICMGDAGYGIIIALYGLFELSGKTKNVPILGEMLSGCGGMILTLGIATTVIGFFLGTFFGINIVEAGWISADNSVGAVLAWLQGKVPGTSYSIQMAAAIAIGVFHICLAMLIKALLYTKKEGLKKHLSTWGWVLLIIGSVVTGVLALTGAMSESVMTLTLICIGAVSAVGIFILNNVDRVAKNPITGLLINPLAGLYDTYNMVSGLLGDVLSYIRLYALCLAGGMLGGAFNMIGDMVGGDGGAMLIPAIVIYVIGHIFNLLMSAISAFVHPLRLNFVEYFKNAGFDGKGTGYCPYRIQK